MGDIHVNKITHLEPDCWRLLEKNSEHLFVKVAQVLSDTLKNVISNRSDERMLLTGKALISSFCEGSDSIFWYDDVLGFPEEEYAEIMSNRFPMQIQLWGAVLPPQISGVRVYTSLKVEQLTIVTSKTSIAKFHRSNGGTIAGFTVTMLMGGGLKLVKATKTNVVDVEKCLNEFQLVFPDILKAAPSAQYLLS
ncbi:uncharacterized protein LOC112557940 [Pomacea canaliculata]|nr:uncharacterized protein LOC112557940 [Pomacea canaliculata]